MTCVKNLIIIGIFGTTLAVLFSCKKGIVDFLDKPPGVDVTIDTIFSSKTQVETFVAGLYYYSLPTTVLPSWDSRNSADGSISGACDEAETTMSWYWTQGWNTGNMTANNILDPSFNNRWQAIRRCNILLGNIDKAPFNDAVFKAQVKGEAKFLRAFNYFEMFERYGGVSIINKPLNLGDTLAVPRSTVEETVNFIVKDCEDAVKDLPVSYSSALRGHATKGAALMLRSRTLLFAASPEFNTATPYLSLGGENNNLICYGNYDKSRWQLAADAAKEVLDWAPSGGCHLITDKGVNKNYQYVWEQPDNAEIILAQKERGPTSPTQYQGYKAYWPTSFGGPGGLTVTLNFVEKYEKKDGTPQTWDPNGGNNLNEMYTELDPRFGQSCAYNGSYWNVDHPSIQLWQGGQDAQCITGVFLRKPIPTALTNSNPTTPNQIEFRLGEAYLNYAEALNEAQGPEQQAYNAVNIIRERSGMPDLPSGLTQEQFRERVRHERTIELAFEGHRIWDVRRWLIANTEGIMKGNMYGIKIYKIANNEFRYEPYLFEIRTFSQRMYLDPFPKSEIDKGYLIQNPGY